MSKAKELGAERVMTGRRTTTWKAMSKARKLGAEGNKTRHRESEFHAP
jgi:hypothetical protein